MRVAVIGSRSFNDYELVKKVLDTIKDSITLIVSGGCKGADLLGERYAKENNIETLIFLPEWDKYNKAAGYIRNKLIIENADLVIAFWDGKSPGTQHSFKLAKELNKTIHIVKI